MIVQPSPENLAQAASIILRGGLVAFPTETVYGLGANALNSEAIEKIYRVKERPFASPLIVHVADPATARSLTSEWSPNADILIEHFWPGPLTLIMKKADVVPDLVTAGLDSVGIRMPSHRVALALIEAAGVPLAAPSANRFMHISPTTAQHVESELGDKIDMILDGGPSEVGIESTVVSLHRTPPSVLRPGMILLEELEAITGVPWDREIDRPHIPEPQESPGLHPRHYAPQTPLFLLAPGETLPTGRGRVLDLPADPKLFAKRLYAAMHEADAEGWDWIGITRPLPGNAWTSILDRLTRAASRKK